MAVYVVTGVMGSGKTLAMVGRARDYLEAGKPVATNVNLDLAKLCAKPVHAPCWRLPDRPRSADLEALGAAHTTGREELNGALILDECGAWLNSRNWGDKDRQAFIDWMLHARKRGWDVFLVVQSAVMLDKQIREGLGEYHVVCKRLDRMRVPFIGGLLKLASFGMLSGNLPKVHVASVFYGMGGAGIKADVWTYLGRDLYAAYSTQQVMEHDASGVQLVTDPRVSSVPAAPVVKPKLPAVLLASKLAREEAWQWARRYVQALGT